MQEVGDEGSHHAKTDGAAQEDSAVEVEFLVGIVPPAGVEEGFQQPAGEVFQNRDNHHAGKEEGDPGVGPGLQQVHDEHSAEPVDRTQWPPQESPIDEVAMTDGAIAGFPYPADETVGQKEHENV